MIGGDKVIEKIENIFKDRKATIMGKYKKSAVMLLLNNKNGEPHILFEVRSYNLKTSPGDICLPGGKMEEGEKPSQTAVREVIEELNIKKEDFKLIGELDYYITPFNFIIYPFIGIINREDFIPNNKEVDEVFWVPLSFFIENEPSSHEVEIISKRGEDFPYNLIENGKNYNFRKGNITQYFYIYENYVIWGFTAYIIKNFINTLREEGLI